MQQVPLEARTQNRSRDERCRYCRDTGQVVAATRPASPALVRGKLIQPAGGAEFEEMGPCPFCETGFYLEFPKAGEGPWGRDGYWQGRPGSDLRIEEEHTLPLPPAEQARRARELIDRLSEGIGRAME